MSPREWKWEPEGFATIEAWQHYNTTRRRPAPEPEHTDPCEGIREFNQADCILCEGAGWVPVPDPLFDGAMVDQRCPACQDHSVRATRTCFENDWGRKVGPA